MIENLHEIINVVELTDPDMVNRHLESGYVLLTVTPFEQGGMNLYSLGWFSKNGQPPQL